MPVSALPELIANKAPGYYGTIMADGPTGFWRVGESAGTSAVDQQAVNAGTYVNAPALATAGAILGDANTAVAFTAASSQDLTLPGPVTTTNCAIEYWFKWTAGTAIMRDHTGSAGWIVGFDNGGTFAVRMAGTTANTSKTTARMRDSNWHHFVMNKTGASGEVWIDAIQVATVGSGLANTAATMPWHVGRNGTAAQYSDCTADEIAIYPAALTAAQIAAHYNAGHREHARPIRHVTGPARLTPAGAFS